MKNKPSHRLFSKLSFKLLKKGLGDFKTPLLSMISNPLTCLIFTIFRVQYYLGAPSRHLERLEQDVKYVQS